MTLSLLALALALGADAAAVSVALGVGARTTPSPTALRAALWFGGAQAIAPIAGWALALAVGPRIAPWDRWLAAAVLLMLAVRMAREALSSGPHESKGETAGHARYASLALATSVDALAAGAALPALGLPPVTPALVVGAVTAGLSYGGVLLGARIRILSGHRLGLLGGPILLGLAARAAWPALAR